MATGIGETLRAARRRNGSTLTDASQATKIRETYLAALEQEEFAGLGGHVYVRGFLRSYARFLDVDPAPLLEAYAAVHQQSERRTALRGPLEEAEPRVRASDFPVVGVAIAGAVVLLVVLLVLLTGGDDPSAALVTWSAA